MQTLPPPVDQLAGQVLGQYNVKQLLGYGNVNAIYAAQQQSQDRPVMLTVFTMPETFSSEARERFLTRFAQVASKLVQLDHPYILPTYDYGAQFGYPYLITPFVTGGSLAKVLQQEVRCAPERVLQILKQVADGLEYAHQNGIVHGTLKPATILLDDEQNVHITGFGLANILKMRGIESVDSPYAHLTSIAGTFLGAAEYIAPEVVQGIPADTRSDIYAVGIMLFELLTGKQPFSGDDPVAVAMQHVQQRVPSLQTFSPDILPGLDLVVQKAVEVDPAQRFQSVSKLAKAFERVLEVIHSASSPVDVVKEAAVAPIADMTMPPTVNWDEEILASEQMSAKLPTLSGHMPTVTKPRVEGGNWQLRPPIVTNQMAAVKATKRSAPNEREIGRRDAGNWDAREGEGYNIAGSAMPWQGKPLPATDDFFAMAKGPEASKGVDPAAFWANGSAPQIARQEPGTFEPETLNRTQGSSSKSKRTRNGRRRVVAMLTTGVVAAGIVGIGGVGITHFLHSQQSGANHPAAPAKSLTAQKNKVLEKQQGNTGKQQNAMTQAKPPAAQAAQKAQQPAHNGVVISTTTQALNSAKDFKNPADGNDSLLVRLPGGTFSAYERACTHQQVAVNYDPATKKFICPLHGSIFDPAQNGKVLQGPATLPLPPVKVTVNADGTVTAA